MAPAVLARLSLAPNGEAMRPHRRRRFRKTTPEPRQHTTQNRRRS